MTSPCCRFRWGAGALRHPQRCTTLWKSCCSCQCKASSRRDTGSGAVDSNPHQVETCVPEALAFSVPCCLGVFRGRNLLALVLDNRHDNSYYFARFTAQDIPTDPTPAIPPEIALANSARNDNHAPGSPNIPSRENRRTRCDNPVVIAH